MSFDPYKYAKPIEDSSGSFDPYKYAKPISTKKADEWTPFIGKSLLKGVTSLADLPANIAHLAERGVKSGADAYRKIAGKEAKFDTGVENDTFHPDKVDRPSKWLKTGAKKAGIDIKPRADSEAKRIAGNALEFAGSAGPFGLLGKGVAPLSRLINAGKQSALSGAIGGASGVAQEAGVDPLYADIGASILAPSTLKVPAATKRVALKSMGLTGKNFNLEAAKNAKELGIDLPAATLTKNGLTRLTEEQLLKVPFIGEKIKAKYKGANEQTQKVIEDLLDKTGPKRTPEWEKLNTKAYKKARNVSDDAKIAPANLQKAMGDIKSHALIQSPDLKSLFKTIKEIKSKIGNNKEVSIKSLIDTKVELNDIIKWDTPTSVKDRLKAVQKGLQNDLTEYGKKNPKWYKDYKDADAGFAAMSKRAKAENELVTKHTNYSTGEVSQNSLAKIINHPKSSKLLEKNLGTQNFEKLKKLGKISEAFVDRSKNILNPSGSSTTGGALLAIASIFTAPKTAIPIAIFGTISNTLFTNQKWIDLAIKAAENPTTANNLLLNNFTKQISGHSLLSLAKEIKK